jgi:hypothetical protein
LATSFDARPGNDLLTLFVKVNIPPAAESQFDNGGLPMKKHVPARWSFWTWLLGGGTANGAASG